ncbi:MAG: OmpH family outer membrane protein [Negativicutes bacterium]|nr:OmpH family outer membrane protein [Negativicutes bacterium]
MLKLEKKKVKLISLTVAILFVLSVVGIAVSQTGTSYAAEKNSSNIGVVDYQMLIYQHPDTAKADEAMQAEIKAAQQDFETKAASMNDKEKQDYYSQVQQRLSLKNQELRAPIFDKINAAIKAVAEVKGLSVVLDKNDVVYGGQVVTDDVMKKINK